MAQVTVELGHLVERTDFELFDFEYQFDDPAMKKELEEAILDFYWFYEIGQEVPDRFKHQFKARFKRVIGFYNKLHNTTLLEYNPLINHKLSEALEQLATTSNTQDATSTTNTDGTTNIDGTTSDDQTVTNDNTRTDDLATTRDGTRTDNLTTTTTENEKTSDYPQQPIAGGDYANGERDRTSDTSNSGTVDNSETGTQTGTVTDSGSTTSNATGTNSQTSTSEDSSNTTAQVTDNGTNNTSYDKTIEGLTGTSYQELIRLERENIVRMKTALINELKPCFILVY